MIKHIFTLIWNKKGSNALILLEILLAFIVLFAVISFVIYNTDRLKDPIGYETEHRKYIQFGDLEHFENDSLRTLALEEMKRSVLDLDLVQSFAYGHDVGPFMGSNWCSGNDDLGFNVHACYAVVSPEFVETNGMKIVAGRNFTEDDINATYQLMIPNKTFMTKSFGEKNMIDSIIPYNGKETKIVGVVEEFKYNGEFNESDNTALLLRNPEFHKFALFTNAYLKMDPSATIAYEEEISKIVESTLNTTSFSIMDAPILRERANINSWIPIIALLSVCIFLCVNVALGLFGVLSYAISRRKAEIGLRRAIGASPGAIIKQFTFEVLTLAGIAIIFGVIIAVQIPIFKLVDIADSIFYRGILYSVLIILLVVASCALFPSIQASKIHPAVALHED